MASMQSDLLRAAAATFSSAIYAKSATAVQVWRVEPTGLTRLAPDCHGQFYAGDCYVILKSQTGACEVFFWLGEDSNADDHVAAQLVAFELDEQAGAVPQSTHTESIGEPSSSARCAAG